MTKRDLIPAWMVGGALMQQGWSGRKQPLEPVPSRQLHGHRIGRFWAFWLAVIPYYPGMKPEQRLPRV